MWIVSMCWPVSEPLSTRYLAFLTYISIALYFIYTQIISQFICHNKEKSCFQNIRTINKLIYFYPGHRFQLWSCFVDLYRYKAIGQFQRTGRAIWKRSNRSVTSVLLFFTKKFPWITTCTKCIWSCIPTCTNFNCNYPETNLYQNLSIENMFPIQLILKKKINFKRASKLQVEDMLSVFSGLSVLWLSGLSVLWL